MRNPQEVLRDFPKGKLGGGETKLGGGETKLGGGERELGGGMARRPAPAEPWDGRDSGGRRARTPHY